jgi:hypothetical protein
MAIRYIDTQQTNRNKRIYMKLKTTSILIQLHRGWLHVLVAMTKSRSGYEVY